LGNEITATIIKCVISTFCDIRKMTSNRNVFHTCCNTGSTIPVYYSWDDICYNERFNEHQQQHILILDDDGDDRKELELEEYYVDNTFKDNDTNIRTSTNNSNATKDKYSTIKSYLQRKPKLLRILDVRRRQNDDNDTNTTNIFRNNDIISFASDSCATMYPKQHQPIDYSNNTVESAVEVIAIKIVRIPINELYERRFELPPRHVQFAVLLDDNNKQSGLVTEASNNLITELSDLQLIKYILLGHDNSSIVEDDVRISHCGSMNKMPKGQSDPNQLRSVVNHLTIQPTNKPWNVSFILMLSSLFVNYKERKDVGVALHLYNSVQADLPTKRNNDSYNIVQGTVPPEQNTQKASFCMQNRFWKPDPMIQHVLASILSQQILLSKQQQQHQNHNNTYTSTNTNDTNNNTEMEIWDLGAGIGRDVCYLAEFLKMTWIGNNKPSKYSDVVLSTAATANRNITSSTTRLENISENNHNLSQRSKTGSNQSNTSVLPFCVVAYDQRYREEKYTNTTTKFWERYNVSDVTQSRLWNWKNTTIDDDKQYCYNNNSNHENTIINTIHQLEQVLQNRTNNNSKSVLCIYAVRFWNRQLFETIASLSNKPNNLIVAISHFGKPKVGSKWAFDHPKVGIYVFFLFGCIFFFYSTSCVFFLMLFFFCINDFFIEFP
jgi:hypothetical protein